MPKGKKASRPARRRSSASRSHHQSPVDPPSGGVTSQFMGAQRKLWEVGASALARSGKLGGPISPVALAESLQGGMKKLEEVFDQRVLNSLSHSGMPSPQELRALLERVESLEAEVERLTRPRPARRVKR